MWNKILILLGIRKRKQIPFYEKELLKQAMKDCKFNSFAEEKKMPDVQSGTKFRFKAI